MHRAPALNISGGINQDVQTPSAMETGMKRGRHRRKEAGPGGGPAGEGYLLADAEAGENASQQIVGAECAGNFAQVLLGQSQIFGQ